MKIGAFTAAGLSLLLASAFGLTAHAQTAPRIIAAWSESFKELNLSDAFRLTTTGNALVLESHYGRYKARATKGTRETIAFSDIGCVTAGGDDIELYPAKRWDVSSVNLVTGKTSPGSSILLTFSKAQQAKIALRELEAASPRIAQKLRACKSDVDLYGLSFGAIPSGEDPFSWQQDSVLGATDYNVWTSDGVLFAEVNTPKFMHHFYKLPLTHIGCVKVQPAKQGLSATIYIYPVLPEDVLARAVGPDKPATFTTSDIGLNLNNQSDADSALQYLQSKSRVFSTKLDACPWPGEV